MTKPFPKAWRDRFQGHPEYLAAERFNEYLPASVDVPKDLRRGVGRVLRPKECHHQAFRYLLAHDHVPGIRLVYGTYDPSGTGPTEHSWVEIPDNIAFDGNAQEFYPADVYRASIKATVIREYSVVEACKLMTATGHTGPWG